MHVSGVMGRRGALCWEAGEGERNCGLMSCLLEVGGLIGTGILICLSNVVGTFDTNVFFP